MAASKKPSASAKKTSTAKTKATAAKPRKTVAKKTSAPAPKKAAVKRSSSKKPHQVQSFRLTSETESFISSRITLQTIYWSVLSAVILIVGVLILNAQLDILETLNQISDGL